MSANRNFALAAIATWFFACTNTIKTSDSNRKNEFPKYSDRSVKYICDVSKDTILLVADSNILLTTNAAKTWIPIKTFPMFNKVVVDDKSTIWAIYYWAGIHEPGLARLFKSSDWGHTWTTYRFNLKLFAPEEIISENHEPLSVMAKENVYELIGPDANRDWKQAAGRHSAVKTSLNKWAPGYTAIDTGETSIVFKNIKGSKSLLVSSDSIGTVSELIKSNDTLFISGNGVIDGDFARPYFAAVVGEKVVKRYKVPAHGMSIVKGTGGRIWAIAGDKLYLKNDTGLVVQRVK